MSGHCAVKAPFFNRPQYYVWHCELPFLVRSKNDPNRLLHVNRFQAAGRARQVYLVDMVSRAIDYRLNWHRNNQDTIFGGEPQMQYNADLHVAEKRSINILTFAVSWRAPKFENAC